MVKIVRNWKDRTKKFQYGQDMGGNLYARHIECSTNMVCKSVDFVKGIRKYLFICPKCGLKKRVI